MQSSAEIRQAFIQFFAERDHKVVPSSPLVPGNDPTLLFTNAGMVQFKETFLGQEDRGYVRAVSSQRCVRAGGKHNDLENVGYTARHHTFFEMLGNFSFGDYFKEEAIRYAWEFLTEVCKLPAEKLWVTVFDEDDETADIWIDKMGVSPDRLSRIGAKDNFWSMGDTGPCGPCSEIFFDHGEDVPGGPPGTPEEDGDRYIEIWNLVFMQYDRDAEGTLNPLPKPSVDTGMGMERLVAVLQNVHSNYEIDLFQHLLKAAAEVTGATDLKHNSLKVIADHIRSCSFMIVDGVLPSNEGRGYVLRRIIRRALRHGHKLGCDKPFFNQLVKPLEQEMGEAYPELTKAADQVAKVLAKEEQRFSETLDKGMGILQAELDSVELDQAKDKTISGETAFKLYDTYGFPVDLTADVAREHGFQVDMAAFEEQMEGQRNRARSASRFSASDAGGAISTDALTEFTGYEQTQSDAQIVSLFENSESVDELPEGASGAVLLDTTTFYAESGGQIGDSGILSGTDFEFAVTDTQKQGNAFLHIGQVTKGRLKTSVSVSTQVDTARRGAIVLNHSATHLMHAALRQVLGDHVQQKGSLVTEQRLRFDFSHFEPMTAEQVLEIETIVNTEIRNNASASAQVMAMDKAIETGAMALFGEKYGDDVRVVNIGFSTELCGGVHVKRAGDIGLFKIVAESGIASGVRRIEAVTGDGALNWVGEQQQQLSQLAGLLKTDTGSVATRLTQMIEHQRSLEKELDQLKSGLAAQAGESLIDQAVEIDGIKVLAAKIDGVDSKALRDTVDKLKDKLGQAAIVVASENAGKISLIAGVTKAETKRIRAGDLVNFVASQVGGKGGGRPDMAQAGGSDVAKLPEALASVNEWVASKLNS